jgi:addiction module HigA family antidote
MNTVLPREGIRQLADHFRFEDGSARDVDLADYPLEGVIIHAHSFDQDACLVPLGLSVTEAANVLGIARHTLSSVLNGHAGISPEMAIRLEKAGWSNADHGLRLETPYDLAQARRRKREIKVRRYQPRSAA